MILLFLESHPEMRTSKAISGSCLLFAKLFCQLCLNVNINFFECLFSLLLFLPVHLKCRSSALELISVLILWNIRYKISSRVVISDQKPLEILNETGPSTASHIGVLFQFFGVVFLLFYQIYLGATLNYPAED